MACVYTGAVVYVRQYDLYANSDLHEFDGAFIFRINNRSIARGSCPYGKPTHTVEIISEWWNRDSQNESSTLVVRAENLTTHE